MSFAESFDLKIIDGGVNDIRIVGTVALAVMILICAIGMEWETKAQNFLIAIIVAAILNFLIGAIVGPSEAAQEAAGFVGFSSKCLCDKNSRHQMTRNIYFILPQLRCLHSIGSLIIATVRRCTRTFSVYLPFSFPVVSILDFELSHRANN